MNIGKKMAAGIVSCFAAFGMQHAISNTITFTTSVGVQPSDVGIITLTQVNANTVDVLLDLKNSTYGIMNSGGPHTPFVFNLAGSQTGITANFIQPAGGTYTFGIFTLNLSGGDATPYGTYGIAIDDSAGNGSSKAYFGDLEFDLTRTGGLLVTDFVTNSDGYYFAADLTDGNNTGSQAWNTRSTNVPDSGATALLLGAALTGIGLIRRKLS